MTAAPAQSPPQECGTFDLGCKAGEAISSTFDSLVNQVAEGAADLVVTTSTWWAETDSVNPADSAVLAAQDVTAPLVAVILVGSVLVQAIRLIISRKGEPLIFVATGLFRYAAVSALGIVLLQSALRAGDALAADLLGDAANSFALLMRDALTTSNAGAFVILLVAVLAALLSLVQWVLMAIRQAGLLVLAAPLAASGSLTRSTRGWLEKLIPWVIALVAYKPAAAFIYYIGFSYLSTTNSNAPGEISTMLTGLMVLVLAVIAMPIMLKFFSWSGIQIGGATGGGSGFLGAAGAVAMARGYGQSNAVRRAAATEESGPGSQGVRPAPRPPGAAPSAARAGLGVAGTVIAAGGAAARGAAGRMSSGPPEAGPPR